MNGREQRTALIAALGIFAVTSLVLRWLGRVWWCACGEQTLWIGDIHSAHTSQHALDPYSATHVLHGILFCGLLALTERKQKVVDRFITAMVMEGLWEIVENTSYVINRYRAETIAAGYTGDSIANSLVDQICAAIGFLLATRLGWKRSAVLFAAIELTLLATTRDNLTLHMLMFAWPIEALKAWQAR